MNCPFCHSDHVAPSKVQGFYYCQKCRAIIRDTIKDDPSLDLYDYKIRTIRTKDPDVGNLFRKCDSKFDDGIYRVIATIMDRNTDYSLLFGQSFFVVIRKKK